jgi:hypothetical protein
VVEACQTPGGIWLRGASPRVLLAIPGELEGFDRLMARLEEWLPESAVRRATPPGGFRDPVLDYGSWMAVGILSVVALTGQRPGIVAPASLVLGVWIAWYFAWCGRQIQERKWKILLPASGYLFGGGLVVRAIALLVAV